MWALIDKTPWLIWQLLTKRPHRYSRYLPVSFKYNNVWLGTTAENQEFYDIRWPILRDESFKRGLVDWISYEPAIGPLTMSTQEYKPLWVIFGGESGNTRRSCDVKWAEDILLECKKYGTKFFMKQMGGRTPLDGKMAIPENLMIQEFPK